MNLEAKYLVGAQSRKKEGAIHEGDRSRQRLRKAEGQREEGKWRREEGKWRDVFPKRERN